MNDTTVAIKVIKRYSSQKVMDQFEKEMSIMSQVSHNNIVRLYGILSEGIITSECKHSSIIIFTGPFSPAMIMEYLPHGNLKSFLKAVHE